MLNGHGDDAFRYGTIRHNFSSNIYGHADLRALQTYLATRLDSIRSYPEPEPRALEALIAQRHGVGEECVMVTSGATEAIYQIGLSSQSILNREGDNHPQKAVIAEPTFSEYEDACRMAGHSVEFVPFEADAIYSFVRAGRADATLWLCNPNNPTGAVLPRKEVLRLAAEVRLMVLDQSYEDYTLEPLLSAREAVEAGNILQLHSLTKTYCIPGLRVGFVVGAPALIRELRARQRPWSVNALAVEAAMWLLKHDVQVVPDLSAYLAEAQRLRSKLADLSGFSVLPTQTNFMLCHLDAEGAMTAARLKDLLATRHGILIRDASNFHGLTPWHFRVAAQTREEDDLLIECLITWQTTPDSPPALPVREGANTFVAEEDDKSWLETSSPPLGGAGGGLLGGAGGGLLRPLMLAGTGSDVGKSVLATALCRIFLQDGYHPAPFKAQNMALNSYATPEGLEIGRAQAVQAEAAGIPCHTDMNPLLLKPQSDHTSQVVLHGKPIGNRDAYDFWKVPSILHQKEDGHLQAQLDFRAEVCAAYDRLAAQYNPIVMEGAGSISELNLRDRDLVNMSMARHADAAVVLVADIDRGGVFASVYGSIALQSPEDRARIKGIIINKFRGDLRLFDSGRRLLEELCGVPVLGVIPHFSDIHIEEEDSVSLAGKASQAERGRVNVAVVLLRHLSNFTDFDALEQDERIHLYYTNNVDELRKADIIILPGSKSTLDDLRELRRNGCAQAIQQAARQGTTVIGICGGYQMMGLEVLDPDRVEGDLERLPGLALLPTTTQMSGQKITRQVHFRLLRTSLDIAPSSSGNLPLSSASPENTPVSPVSINEAAVPVGSPTGLSLSAYEIHMGETRPFGDAPARPFALLDDGRTDGYFVSDRCWGTYLHGVLDNAPVVDALLAPFADRLSAEAAPFDYAAFKEEQYDRLADHVRLHLDLERLYEIMRN